MPRIARWDNLTEGVRQHLINGMETEPSASPTSINFASGLNRSRHWYKDFGSFKICGRGSYFKTFLLPGQLAKGEALSTKASMSIVSGKRSP
jgi:hypothetical protein